MSALKLIEEINIDAIKDVDVSRRDALSKGISFGFKAALAAIPIAIMELTANKTYAAPAPSNSTIVGVLNFALTLEYLESSFYTMGLNSNIIPASDLVIIQQISKHETSHVVLLKSAIMSLQGTPVNQPTFDFTASGAFPDVFTNYQTFLALANAFEDTGVRAYKGQAPALQGSGSVLTTALDIHSVEARHAAQIRRLRGYNGWITNALSNGLPAAIYAGEDNIMQGGLDVSTITSIAKSAITEAFDEPLTQQQVLAIASPFIK